MVLQLRHRLILVWLGTIVLAMSVAAGLFIVLLLDFYQADAQSRLLAGFSQLQNRFNEIGSVIRENGNRFAERQESISSLSMIDRYQKPVSYQPLVFDPEKKRLAGGLADLVETAGLSQAVLYSRTSAVAGFSNGSPAFISYDDKGQPVLWRAPARGRAFSRQPDVPNCLLTPAPTLQAQADVVRLRLSNEDAMPVIDGIIPLLRSRGDAKELIGHLVLSQFLDKRFIDGVARSIGLDLRLCGVPSPSLGERALPCPSSGEEIPELSRITKTGMDPFWISTDTHYGAAVRLPLGNSGEVYLVLGLNKVFLNVQLHSLRTALLAGLIFATLLILGIGLLYLRGTLTRPLKRLLEGIEAVSGGRFVAVEGAEKDDELGRVASAFNTMAAKLDAQHRKLRNLNSELEQRVEQRTAELAHARDSAEAANHAKSLFLANMSHELRTPLNAILGFAQLIQQDQNITPKQKNDLLTIDHSGQHLLGLINDVLEISRIESGRVSLELKAFNLPSMLGSVEEMIRVRADKQGLSLRMELADDLPDYVEGDEHRLRQVLLNLLGNAVKYTESGGVTMHVRPDNDQAAPAIRFEVEDSGPGISEEDRQRIFDAFFQTSEGAAKGEGTGLGLAISRQYVSLMGGGLKVESHPGEGSQFYFSIPLREVESAVVEEVAGERQVLGLEPGQRSYRILIVEDNNDNRQLLRRILEGVGLTVREAADGRQALEQFEKWRPHFIWMDMRMPVIDGYEATRRIKAHPAGSNAVVVALTASAFEEERSEVLAAGCDDFLRKPIRQSLIYATLERHLGLHFRYAEDEQPTPAMADEELAQALGRLPGELRTTLRNQALALDTHAMETSMQEICAIDGQLGDALHAMLEEYRFDEILHLLESEPPHQPDTEEP